MTYIGGEEKRKKSNE